MTLVALLRKGAMNARLAFPRARWETASTPALTGLQICPAV